MKVLILAAGQGKRLLPLTKDQPKCLLQVGGQSILERQIDICRKFGLNKIFVVVGFKSQMIKHRMGNSIKYILNESYLTTNSLYSFWLTRDYIDEDLIILNSDVLFHKDILRMLLESKEKDVISVEFKAHL